MNRFVLTLALLPLALATAAGTSMPLLTDPAAPSAGLYLRLDDNAIVDYRPAQYAVVPVGFSSGGTLLSHDQCPPTPNAAWCEPELAGTCTWSPGPFPPSPAATDHRNGICVVGRAASNGEDAWFQARAAVRAAIVSNPATATQLFGVWKPKILISWWDDNDYLGNQGAKNPSEAQVNFTGCTVGLAGQQATTAHWLGDCVWLPTDVENIEDHIPEGLVGTPTGFELTVIMTLGDSGNGLPSTTVICRQCFRTDP